MIGPPVADRPPMPGGSHRDRAGRLLEPFCLDTAGQTLPADHRRAIFRPIYRVSARSWLIDLPQAPAGIDTSRIALSKSPFSLDYFADLEWTDRVPDLIQNLLLASFENSGAIIGVDRDSGGLRADVILRTEIRHFEAIYADRRAARLRSRSISLLVSSRCQGAQSSPDRRFEQRAPAAANDIPSSRRRLRRGNRRGVARHRRLDPRQSRFIASATPANVSTFRSHRGRPSAGKKEHSKAASEPGGNRRNASRGRYDQVVSVAL